MIVVNDTGIYINNGKGATIDHAGPSVMINKVALVVIVSHAGTSYFMWARVICAHGGQAQPTAPNPRVTGQRHADRDHRQPVRVAGCPFSSPARKRPVRYGAVAGRRDCAYYSRRAAGVAANEPVDLHADRRRRCMPIVDANAGERHYERSVDYPFHFDTRGRTARHADDEHIRDLIEQVLFTAPGERVNRPTFGCGLLQLVFAPNSDELAATSQFLVQGALQQWLGDLIAVESVQVESEDATLRVRFSTLIRRTQTRAGRGIHAGEASAHDLFLLRSPSGATSSSARAFNGIDYPRSARSSTIEVPIRQRQKKLVRSFYQRPYGLSRSAIQHPDRRRRAHPRHQRRRARRWTARMPRRSMSTCDQYGDFSIYTLRLVRSANDPQPPDKIDPMFAAIDFSFKVECPTDFDCQPQCVCPPAVRVEPEIDYLAKDYASFRRLMLDRMALLMPALDKSAIRRISALRWSSRSPTSATT